MAIAITAKQFIEEMTELINKELAEMPDDETRQAVLDAFSKQMFCETGKEGGEMKRIPRKAGQPAKSDKHSDLYTDEDPKGTITGLKFATAQDARASVSKIKSSGRSHAHKIQAAIAMEQRAKVMGKTDAAGVYRKFIDSVKKK